MQRCDDPLRELGRGGRAGARSDQSGVNNRRNSRSRKALIPNVCNSHSGMAFRERRDANHHPSSRKLSALRVSRGRGAQRAAKGEVTSIPGVQPGRFGITGEVRFGRKSSDGEMNSGYE